MSAPFQFKQFNIQQSNAAMKVGTDGVLIGAWTPIQPCCKYVLDIGTGTGLLALMIAQRHLTAKIDAVELDNQAMLDADQNIKMSPWSKRIKLHHCDILNYRPVYLYDLIVCNPPYFISSLKSNADSRNKARHTDALSHDDLLNTVAQLLAKNGRFALILPCENFNYIKKEATQYGLQLEHSCEVFPSLTKKVTRMMASFIKTQETIITQTSTLVIEKERHVYTDDYIGLTHAFYLKM